MATKTHKLKVLRQYFNALVTGEKTFEVREDDRGFAVGDTLSLLEWEPSIGDFTGRKIEFRVTYKMSGGKFGIDPRFCVLGIRALSPES